MHFNRLPGKRTFILGLISDRVEQDRTKQTGICIRTEKTLIKKCTTLHYQGAHVSSLLTCYYLLVSLHFSATIEHLQNASLNNNLL